MGPKLGLLGPINSLLVYLVQSSRKTFLSPKAGDLHSCEADHLSTLFSLLIIVSKMSWILHQLEPF